MGDYNTPELEIGTTILTEFSNDWVINGQTSLKAIENSETSTSGSRVGYLLDTSEFSEKTIKFQVNTKTDKTNWKLELWCYDGTWASSTRVDIPTGESTVYLEKNIPSDVTRLWFRIVGINALLGDTIYTDNWSLEEV